MFSRAHHQRIADVLTALDGGLLVTHNCWFGGGTAIVLENDEYRESVDIDFLVSDRASYAALRQIVREGGVEALASPGLARTQLETARTPRIDTYGIRTAIAVADTTIKFEIVHEGRIEFDVPPAGKEICGVRTLTRTDQVASKLLANDDRWADTSTYSRDLIDLAMMHPDPVELEAGATKAVEAYGKTVGESLEKAVERIRDRPERLDACISALSMDVPRAVVWQEIRTLAKRCAGIEVLGPSTD